MQIGTQIVALADTAVSLFTPWFPKMADNAVFAYETISSNVGSTGTVTVEVYTKNREDLGIPSSAAATINTSMTTGFQEKNVTGLKELVRFKITVTPSGTFDSPAGVIYRILPPTWYDTAV